MQSQNTLPLVVALSLFFVSPVWSKTTHHVPADYSTIQQAINAASAGDVVVVGPGTYPETIDFGGKQLVVQSSAGAEVTTISRGCGGTQQCPIVRFVNNEDMSSVLNGFTITGAYMGGGIYCKEASPTIRNCIIEGNSGGAVRLTSSSPAFIDCSLSANESPRGGALWTRSSSPTLIRCTLEGNHATTSGAIHSEDDSSLTLVDCEILDNSSYGGGTIDQDGGSLALIRCVVRGNDAYLGGGLYLLRSTATVTECEFSNNDAFQGGGVRIVNSQATFTSCRINENTADHHAGVSNHDNGGPVAFTDCTIIGNTTSGQGGGVAVRTCNDPASATTLTRCVISGNSADIGGGIYNAEAVMTLTNCVVSGNSARWVGGIARDKAPFHYGSPLLTLIHCTIAHNSATEDVLWPSLIANDPVVITNSIFRDTNWGLHSSRAAVDVRHSNIYGGADGPGNLDLNPLFVDADGADNILGTEDDDYRLLAGSPSINLGNNNEPGLPVTDLAGAPRIVCTIVDMGAYEAAEPVAGCAALFVRGDANGDSVVGLLDGLYLLAFQFNGGAQPPCMEAADVDDSGSVQGLADGLYLLSYLYGGGPAPAVPFPSCGSDPDSSTSAGCDVDTCP